jgi:ATP-dependent helicase Lhr and Lhr-like helicase
MTSSRADLARMMPDAFPIFFTGRQPYPGQATVMPEMVRGHNVLFAAPTASGKTEAAMAPLYQRHISFKRRNLSTLYVAPTKALVNDLYERLVTYLGTRQQGAIARYTGDRHELRTASGVFCLLATPEALDSLQLRRPEMLVGVRAVVIDEIHLLHGQPRGQQLRHVIARIGRAAAPPASPRDGLQVVGMTATLDESASVAEIWLGDGAKVVSHGVPRDIDLQLIDLGGDGEGGRLRARGLARWLNGAGAEKVLVFANSRNGAHALAAHLHHELEGTRWPVHLHFGALAAAERERVEEEMRMKRYGVCVATSTLEIGIDIGDVDAVVLSDPPRSVTGFLQRIGRGNRRSGVCRVVAFRESDDDERLIRALVGCAGRGELDDIHEYDRPSVRFQQVLSLSWRATRQDRPLSVAALCAEAYNGDHEAVIHDMIETGCLADVRGALIPCDRLIDEADAGQIHTVISGRAGSAVVDIRTGRTAIWDADESTAGAAVFSRRRHATPDVSARRGSLPWGCRSIHTAARPHQRNGTRLADKPKHHLGPGTPEGLRSHSLAATWREAVDLGGEIFNTLLAALFTRQAAGHRFIATPEGVFGPTLALDVSLDAIRSLASAAERTGDLPLSIAGKFINPSRFLAELSNNLAAREKRQSVPWASFHRWLDRIEGIDAIGSMPHEPGRTRVCDFK